MDFIEAGNLSTEQEFNHWWIVTRFRYVERVLALATSRQPALSVIEFGCGTGQNLRFCRQRSRFTRAIDRVTGVDPAIASPTREAWMQDRDRIGPDAQPGAQYDVLLAMDVLEHVKDDAGALSHWLTYLRPGGYVLVTVPAFPWLWSYHDDRLGHIRRHTRASLNRLATACALEPVTTRYAFGYLLPGVAVTRKLIGSRTDSTDLRPHSAPINWLLTQAGRVEAGLGGNRWGGTSVVGIFRRP
jgi:2-polyprenyl-3-methyl-5-hydroxy-6-metoxy-1,4-benzoquinol methylase